ncbi:MAG: hypothetical protein R2769_03515 [Saprospiraceae bacterium]
MESNKITALLEKYFEGQTSLEEEKQLRDFFSKENIPEHLLPYKGLFNYFEVEQEASLSENFDEKILEKIQKSEMVTGIRRMNFTWVRVAAMLAIAIGGLFLVKNFNTKSQDNTIDWSKYEAQTPEEAYEETIKALAVVSKKLNAGEKETRKGMEKIRKINKEVIQ